MVLFFISDVAVDAVAGGDGRGLIVTVGGDGGWLGGVVAGVDGVGGCG